MWKYVSRRVRDTLERSVNKRSSAGIVNSAGNGSDQTGQRSSPPSQWFCPRRCWDTFRAGKDTNKNRWNFDQLNYCWIGAMKLSGGLVLGWYTTHMLLWKLKYHLDRKKVDFSKNTLVSSLYPYMKNVNINPIYLDSTSQIEKVLVRYIPTVHLIANEKDGVPHEKVNGAENDSSSGSSPDDSSDDFGDVLNSIENKLGLAAIESGQHETGLNMLRSAAIRKHAPAMYNLALCYEMGLGVPVNENTAMELYREAAAQEHPGALYNLAVYYGQGRGGLTRNMERATRLMRLAAAQGLQDAINALSLLEEDNSTQPQEHNWNYHSTPFSVIPHT